MYDADLREIDRAVVSACVMVSDFSRSDAAKRLSPPQIMSAIAIASAEEADRHGVPRPIVTAKLREIADALDQQ